MRPLLRDDAPRDVGAIDVLATHVETINTLLSGIDVHNNAKTDAKQRFTLQPVPAPRYWQPNEPVVLLTGDAVQPTTRPSLASMWPFAPGLSGSALRFPSMTPAS